MWLSFQFSISVLCGITVQRSVACNLIFCLFAYLTVNGQATRILHLFQCLQKQENLKNHVSTRSVMLWFHHWTMRSVLMTWNKFWMFVYKMFEAPIWECHDCSSASLGQVKCGKQIIGLWASLHCKFSSHRVFQIMSWSLVQQSVFSSASTSEGVNSIHLNI